MFRARFLLVLSLIYLYVYLAGFAKASSYLEQPLPSAASGLASSGPGRCSKLHFPCNLLNANLVVGALQTCTSTLLFETCIVNTNSIEVAFLTAEPYCQNG